MQTNVWDALRSDTYRAYGKFGWLLVFKGAMTRRNYRVIVMMRLCQAFANSRGAMRLIFRILKVLHRLSAHWAAVDFSWETTVGDGLAITHGWGLVIHPNVRIGNNVTLFHGVTLGCRDRIARDGSRVTEYPVIEDNVWVGPNAVIVGDVTIGEGSRIAGGAFVTESVPPFSIVSGNPATIVKSNCVPDVVNPAPLNRNIDGSAPRNYVLSC